MFWIWQARRIIWHLRESLQKSNKVDHRITKTPQINRQSELPATGRKSREEDKDAGGTAELDQRGQEDLTMLVS